MTVRLRAKTPPVAPDVDGVVETVELPTLVIEDLPNVLRKFRFEFGWDWWIPPGSHIVEVPNGPFVDQVGRPWLFARVQYQDNGVWRNPLVEQSTPTNPRQNPTIPGQVDRNFDGTGGWIKYGLDERYELSGGTGATVEQIGCDRREWQTASASPENPVLYPYLLMERVGTADVDWKLDTVSARSYTPQPLTVMVNTVGYDTAAPQWAAIRPNRTQYRETLDGFTLTKAELVDGNGAVLRSLANGNLTVALAAQCFRELDDWEKFPYLDKRIGFPQIDEFKLLYWRRIDWTQVTTPTLDCHIHLEGTTPAPESAAFVIDSHLFDIDEEIWWNAVWPDIAIANEQARRNFGGNFPEGGWSDAGNQNGEGRAHGLFISGMAHVLRERRTELSTEDVSDLVLAASFGADWIMKLVEENTTDDGNAAARREAHLGLTQGCQTSIREDDHYFDENDSSGIPVAGHIWEDHHSRPRGNPPPEYPDDDVNDRSNEIEFMFNCEYGLLDAALALRPFIGAADSDTYANQANLSRDYFYWLDNHCELNGEDRSMNSYLEFRMQAGLDSLFALYDDGLLPPNDSNDPGPGAPATTNVELARRKLAADLITYPPSAPPDAYIKWAGCGAKMFAPQIPPWFGLARMLEFGDTSDTWLTHLSTIAQLYYVDDVHADTVLNPLSVSRFWSAVSAVHQNYKGDTQRPNGKALYEAYSTAWLANELGPQDPSYDELRLLTVGSLHWSMGIHYGIRGRYALPPSDREWECCSFVINVGSAHAVQNLIAVNYWDEPSVIAGPGGSLRGVNENFALGPDQPPWSYTPQRFGNTESYIQRDGGALMACESATRLYHPSRALEAEDGTLVVDGPAYGPIVVANNDTSFTLDEDDLYNGGESWVGFDAFDAIEFTIDPAAGTGAPDPNANERDYWILFRGGNASQGAKQIDVEVWGTGSFYFHDTAWVDVTGHEHNCVVVKFDDAVTLNKNNVYTVRLTASGGDVSFDSLVIKSRGL